MPRPSSPAPLAPTPRTSRRPRRHNATARNAPVRDSGPRMHLARPRHTQTSEPDPRVDGPHPLERSVLEPKPTMRVFESVTLVGCRHPSNSIIPLAELLALSESRTPMKSPRKYPPPPAPEAEYVVLARRRSLPDHDSNQALLRTKTRASSRSRRHECARAASNMASATACGPAVWWSCTARRTDASPRKARCSSRASVTPSV